MPRSGNFSARPRSKSSSISAITSSTSTPSSSACSERHEAAHLWLLHRNGRRSQIIVVKDVEEPRKENRGIVHIKENLAVIAGRELPAPEVFVCGILHKRRKVFFQPGAADADNRPEPVRPDQPLERYASQLPPGPQ